MTVSADPSDGPSADSAAGPSGGHRAALLEARGLTRRFGALTALDSVDFIGHRGQVHALTGANGAGKSTLMNLLAGVHAPTAGEVRIDGKPVRFASPAHARATGISAVYQELTVLPQLTVAQNIGSGASRALVGGCWTARRCSRAPAICWPNTGCPSSRIGLRAA